MYCNRVWSLNVVNVIKIAINSEWNVPSIPFVLGILISQNKASFWSSNVYNLLFPKVLYPGAGEESEDLVSCFVGDAFQPAVSFFFNFTARDWRFKFFSRFPPRSVVVVTSSLYSWSSRSLHGGRGRVISLLLFTFLVWSRLFHASLPNTLLSECSLPENPEVSNASVLTSSWTFFFLFLNTCDFFTIIVSNYQKNIHFLKRQKQKLSNFRFRAMLFNLHDGRDCVREVLWYVPPILTLENQVSTSGRRDQAQKEPAYWAQSPVFQNPKVLIGDAYITYLKFLFSFCLAVVSLYCQQLLLP